MRSVESAKKHPKDQKAQDETLGILGDADDVFRGSVFLGRQPVSHTERVDRVIERIIRGLFFHEIGHPVPSTHAVKAWLQPKTRSGFREIITSMGFKLEEIVRKGDFQYVYQAVPEEPNSTLWILRFYGRVSAAGFTIMPKEQRPRMAANANCL